MTNPSFNGIVICESERFVVREDVEMPSLQHVTNVRHCLVDRQELSVVGTLYLLCRTQFPGEEGEVPPDVLHPLLEDGSHGGG